MRVLVIDNRRSGQGNAGLDGFVRELRSAGADVVVRRFEPGQQVMELLDDASSFDRVVGGGGDGTTSAVTYALRGTGIPVVAYPAGTANLLAINLGLPWEPDDLARLTLRGRPRCTDLGEICVDGHEPMGFAIMAGAGFDAKVMEGAAEAKSSLGVLAYFLSVMRNLTPMVSTFRMTLDGEQVELDGIAVILINFAKLQFDLAVAPGTDASDGLLDVAVIRTRSVPELIPTVWQAVLDRLGSNPERSGLEIRRAREITVEADPPLPLQYDGEVAGATTPFTARVLPCAATFIVPES